MVLGIATPAAAKTSAWWSTTVPRAIPDGGDADRCRRIAAALASAQLVVQAAPQDNAVATRTLQMLDAILDKLEKQSKTVGPQARSVDNSLWAKLVKHTFTYFISTIIFR